METHSEAPGPSSDEQKNLPPEQESPPPEEPILLSKLFPKAKQDLDALFPDPGMKKFLKDLVRTRQKNDRFLKKIDFEEDQPEEDEEDCENPLNASVD